MALFVRDLTDEERAKLARLARSQTAPVRLARRAEIVLRSAAGATAPAIARGLGLAEKTVRAWLERFNAAGLEGLDDAPRAGRPPTYTEESRGRVIAKARGRPPEPAAGEVPPTCHWTLDRLAAALNAEGVPIRRSQVRRILKADGITVLCVDELGPVAARAYPGPSWADAGHRPHFRPDYRRDGYLWAYGAL